MTFAELFNPAGHGPFILASYAISFVVLLWNIVAPLVQGRRMRQQIRSQIRARKPAA